MAKSVPGATTRRRPASGRPGAPLVATQAVRMNLFVLVRILFQYLERVDRSVLVLAKEVLKDCERKHNSKDSKYETLADAIGERVRDAVGETHWAQARKIQKQLAVNQQKKKLKAMQQARQRGSQHQPLLSSQKASKEQLQSHNAALEAAKTMSAMSQQPSPAPSASNLFSVSKCVDQEMKESNIGVPTQMTKLGAKLSHSTTNNEAASIPRQELGGVGGPALAGQHLPFRKRITFAPIPSSSSSPADMSSPTNFSTSHH